MASFKNNPININELMIWKRNPLINPRTNRKIVNTKKTYKYILDRYNLHFPKDIDIFDSTDERDPISLNKFYMVDKDNQKTLVYQNIENLILYSETDTIVRCFEKESLQHMKAYNILLHPVSQKEIPDDILCSVINIELPNETTLEEKALQVFQLFTNISIFIDYKHFLNLNRSKILKLNYELKEFYYQNISIDDRKKIDNTDGNQYFNYNNNYFDNKNDDYIKIYVLDNIENILKYKESDLKYMINYIILGGLSLVIDEVKDVYDDFNFSF